MAHTRQIYQWILTTAFSFCPITNNKKCQCKDLLQKKYHKHRTWGNELGTSCTITQIIEVVNNVKLTCAILHARFTKYDGMQKGFQ